MLPQRREKVSKRKFGHGAGCWFELMETFIDSWIVCCPNLAIALPTLLTRASHLGRMEAHLSYCFSPLWSQAISNTVFFEGFWELCANGFKRGWE